MEMNGDMPRKNLNCGGKEMGIFSKNLNPFWNCPVRGRLRCIWDAGCLR